MLEIEPREVPFKHKLAWYVALEFAFGSASASLGRGHGLQSMILLDRIFPQCSLALLNASLKDLEASYMPYGYRFELFQYSVGVAEKRHDGGGRIAEKDSQSQNKQNRNGALCPNIIKSPSEGTEICRSNRVGR